MELRSSAKVCVCAPQVQPRRSRIFFGFGGIRCEEIQAGAKKYLRTLRCAERPGSAGSKGAILQAGGHDLTGNNLYEMMQNTSIERDQLLDFSARGAQRSLAASEARLGGYRVRGM